MNEFNFSVPQNIIVGRGSMAKLPEIAKKMDCSTSGVRWNFQEMITKAGYSCKEDLIAAALESKLIVTTLK